MTSGVKMTNRQEQHKIVIASPQDYVKMSI